SASHDGNFHQGQIGADYDIEASNVGTGSTSGTVTVSDTLPAGLTATSISGTGWTCTQPAGPCSRNDALSAGLSYPEITLTVNVVGTTFSISNTAAVSGGGETNLANDSASDETLVAPPPFLVFSGNILIGANKV